MDHGESVGIDPVGVQPLDLSVSVSTKKPVRWWYLKSDNERIVATPVLYPNRRTAAAYDLAVGLEIHVDLSVADDDPMTPKLPPYEVAVLQYLCWAIAERRTRLAIKGIPVSMGAAADIVLFEIHDSRNEQQRKVKSRRLNDLRPSRARDALLALAIFALGEGRAPL